MKLGKPEIKPVLMQALYDLTGGQTMNVAMRDDVKNSTFTLLGVDPDSLGEVTRGAKAGTKIADKLISACFSELKKEGHTTSPLRNRYALTDSGLNWCLSQSFTLPNGGVSTPAPVAAVAAPEPVEPTPAPEVAPEVAPEPVVVAAPEKKVAPKRVAPKLIPVVAPVGRATTFDPYIKSLMVQSSPCYGVNPSTRAKTCKSCPLLADCQRERNTRLIELAASLEQQAARLEVVDLTVAEPEEPSLILPESATWLDEIDIDGMECEGCGHEIPRGQKAVILKGNGIFHPHCAAEAANGNKAESA